MNVRTFALICGTVGVAFASAVVACSSSNSGGGGGGGEDGGSSSSGSSSSGSSSGSSSSGSSSGTSSSSSSSSSGSSSGTCEDPTVHAPGTAGSVFCGYGADGGDVTCTTGNTCCLGGTITGGYAPDQCNAIGTACANGTSPVTISCNQVADCTANGVTGAACCLQGGENGGVPAQVSGCDAADLKLSGGTAVVCEAPSADAGASDAGAVPSCAAGETQICSSQADCPTGKTCTAMHWKIYDIGFCQ